ncbi:MAG: SIS domain-containing protein [Caldilineaceae bacterium]
MALADFGQIQPEVQALAVLNPSTVLCIGCGSTYYLAQIAAHLIQSLTGRPARAWPSSELLLFDADTLLDPQRTLLLTISRSGTTTETVAAAALPGTGGAESWTICCNGSSPWPKAPTLPCSRKRPRTEHGPGTLL